MQETSLELAFAHPISVGKDYKFHTAQYEPVMFMVEVYERGQIVIPKYVREMLKVGPGTNLSVNVENGKIILEQYDPVEGLEKIRAKYAKHTVAEINKKMAEIEKKKLKELMPNVH